MCSVSRLDAQCISTANSNPNTQMKEKVYIDSTIPSYYFDRRKSLATFTEITRQWWSEMAGEYELSSEAVPQTNNA
uniref:Uncharacterized protein n=1 Tax=Candidatus Kentrum sp. LPFa TaxID=2126335 RepID=A0A450W846_9GAMM|nr:MAG: hypothetical protein BECKLPF1236A_GA0070988_100821 [Candidatus Kentron sp. LPFa]VFK29325.1 MAG: hypothetical protein BECKLPF1236C_GA0070990_100852 [Candidatus Kentron sp. LPFa]